MPGDSSRKQPGHEFHRQEQPRGLLLQRDEVQAPSLLPWRTTVDNVLLPLEIVEPYRSQFKTKRAEFWQRACALLQSVGLGGHEDMFPWQLSGGMQQRASICRALIDRRRSFRSSWSGSASAPGRRS